MNPVERATALGGTVAARSRSASSAVSPHRPGGTWRATCGAPSASARSGRPIATDPDEAYLPPGGIARKVHGDLPAMLIGGVTALLLQTLHPLAMAGVAEHSSYQEDPLGRLRRTASFVGTTTFGTVAEAEAAIAQVQPGPPARPGHRARRTAPTRPTTPSW